MRRLTYQQVKSHIESLDGYKLLSRDYRNSHHKLKIKCINGHIFWKTYANFKKGHECVECNGRRKFTYEEVKNFIESHRYRLLSGEYINSGVKLNMKCPEGHVFWKPYHKFRTQQICPECAGKKRRDYKEIKEYVESRGYTLLSNVYKNSTTKLQMVCPSGHIVWKSYSNFTFVVGCPECVGNQKISNQKIVDKLSFCEDIRETEDEQIEVKCTYCGDWHVPNRKHLLKRIRHVYGGIEWENRLYCSQQCKNECPIYGQHSHPKDFKLATSREVQPELRQLVLKRDNYICQKCNKHKDELEAGLHCHHIWPLNEDPVTSADADECITLCKDCHKWVHMNVPGCGYGEMGCSLENVTLV